jgi:hypothetical protein
VTPFRRQNGDCCLSKSGTGPVPREAVQKRNEPSVLSSYSRTEVVVEIAARLKAL